MCDLDPFDRDVLAILLFVRALALSTVAYGHKLSFYLGGMSVASFGEELWIRNTSSEW